MIRNKKTFFSDPQHILPRLVEVVEACDELADQIYIVGEAVDDIKQTLGDLAQIKPDLNALLPPIGTKKRGKSPPPAVTARYATAVTLTWEGNRSRAVIDGHSIELPAMLGMLLELLLSEEPDPCGVPVRDGWHSRSSLEVLLSNRVGRAVSRHALENLISRLKGELRKQANLAELIQTDDRGEVRIAQRKHLPQSPVVPPSDSLVDA
jgi:hypothetical protein